MFIIKLCLFYLGLDLITLVLKLDLDIVKVYACTENKDLQWFKSYNLNRQTDRQIHTFHANIDNIDYLVLIVKTRSGISRNRFIRNVLDNDISFPLVSLLVIHCYYQDKQQKTQKLLPKVKHRVEFPTNYTFNCERFLTDAQRCTFQKEYVIKIKLVKYLFKKVSDLSLFTGHNNFVCQGQELFIIESANKGIQNMFNILFPNVIFYCNSMFGKESEYLAI